MICVVCWIFTLWRLSGCSYMDLDSIDRLLYFVLLYFCMKFSEFRKQVFACLVLVGHFIWSGNLIFIGLFLFSGNSGFGRMKGTYSFVGFYQNWVMFLLRCFDFWRAQNLMASKNPWHANILKEVFCKCFVLFCPPLRILQAGR